MKDCKKDPVNIYIGKRLYEIRMQKGLTYKDLAQKTFMTPEHLQAIEAGTHRQLISHIRKIVEVLGVDHVCVYDGLEEVVTVKELARRAHYVEKLFVRITMRYHAKEGQA